MNRQEFMDKYRHDHYCCPKCHSKNYSCTLVGYVYDENHPENYKDKNHIECFTCGWKGIYHDLVEKPEKTGFKVAYTTFAGLVKDYDDKIYTKQEAKILADKLDKGLKDYHDYRFTHGMYIYYEIGLNI